MIQRVLYEESRGIRPVAAHGARVKIQNLQLVRGLPPWT